MFEPHVYAARRKRVAALIGNGAVAIIPSGKTKNRNGDVDYLFRPESSFLWLTGFSEPDAVLVIVGGPRPAITLFVTPNDSAREIWTGKCEGVEEAKRIYGLESALPLPMLNEWIKAIIRDRKVHYPTKRDPRGEWIGESRHFLCSPYLDRTIDSEILLARMRLVKDEHELALMRRAAQLTAGAHLDLLWLVHPGMTENEVAAELAYRFIAGGGHPDNAYPSIVAGGINACILHYTKNRGILRSGNLLLTDAGMELDGYASDVTRTIPVDGHFTEAERAVYNLVRRTQSRAIRNVRPGMTQNKLQDITARSFASGFFGLGLFKDKMPREIVTEKLYKHYYMHWVSHFLGLDVHDEGSLTREEARNIPFEPGMVITVEPALYFRQDDIMVPPWLRNIAVRIEDDVIVRENGAEVISGACPKDPDVIESLMAHAAEQRANDRFDERALWRRHDR